MLAKLATELPAGDGWLFEPKWDGFRAIVFRDGDRLYIQSRDLKPLDRYFPELATTLADSLPARCVVDGEIVIAGEHGLDFDALQMRLHPAASRVKKLAAEMPRRSSPSTCSPGRRRPAARCRRRERRQLLEQALARASGGVASDAVQPRPRAWRTTGSIASRAPASTASSPSTSGTPTSPASAP